MVMFCFVMEPFEDCESNSRIILISRLCMRHITATVKRLEEGGVEAERAGSLVESILKQHSDPKMAAVLALDLFLVGVDTVSQSYLLD